jgi:RimJ/RimL family protein N-acetyltransferase
MAAKPVRHDGRDRPLLGASEQGVRAQLTNARAHAAMDGIEITPQEAGEVRFRRPAVEDYLRLVDVVDDWWGARAMRHLLPRLWVEHFSGTSIIAETATRDLAGFLFGFRSPDHPNVAYVHLVATNPKLRRSGIAKAMYEQFFRDMTAVGVSEIEAITWPGNAASLAFHLAMGFRPAGLVDPSITGTQQRVRLRASVQNRWLVSTAQRRRGANSLLG